MSTGGSPAPRDRIAWLDIARAMSIVLVVIYHVAVGGAGHVLLGGRETFIGKLWLHGNLALVPLRMPLFFMVSGVLAAGAIRRSWKSVVRPRIYDLLWPYVLWSMIWAATAWPRYAPNAPGEFFVGEITGLLMIGSPYWFIAVLPIFFVITRLGSSRPKLLVTLSLIAYAAAPFIQRAMRASEAPSDLVYGVFQLTDNALWFALGFAARDWILRIGARPRPVLGSSLLLAFCLLALIVERGDLAAGTVRALELGASVSGLVACAALLPLAARWDALARAGTYLGSRTLVIYLVHPVIINLIVLAWRDSGAEDAFGGMTRDLLMVPVVTVLCIAASVAVQATVDRIGPRWLLKAPGGGAPAGREMHNTVQARRSSS
ncbi:MAG TPA: acyltransferase [Jiangellaceae bacterium]|nr:acyltransferase [Jiangellaceae bacterium]